jgi:3,4-dihydroxy-2-butanone 4-phosphate synthase
MKLLFKAGMASVVLAGLLAILSTPAESRAQESDLILRAKLVSFNQVPSVLSNARGAF